MKGNLIKQPHLVAHIYHTNMKLPLMLYCLSAATRVTIDALNAEEVVLLEAARRPLNESGGRRVGEGRWGVCVTR